MQYKIVKGKYNERYMLNGRFIRADLVPDEVKAELEIGVAYSPPETAQSVKTCLFCGGGASETRFVNMQTIALCDEHYYSTNIGQIVKQLKETSDG